MTVQLDLDDLDYDYHNQLSNFYSSRNLFKEGIHCARKAQHYLKLENMTVPFCDAIFVASEKDRVVFADRHPKSNVSVLPNVVPSANVDGRTFAQRPKKLLFLGTLGYQPNLDGLEFFIKDIWPIVRNLLPDCRLIVAGKGLPKLWQKCLHRELSVDYLGELETVDKVYQQASAAIIPLRLGGGTRIKVLEAFDRYCPVVSTSQGIYGLNVEHNKHLLVADEAAEFAEACYKILTDHMLAAELTERASQLVKEQYSIEKLKTILQW